MLYLKLYIKNLLIPFILIVVGNLIITILSYFNLISIGLVSIFQMILMSIAFLIGGYKIAVKSSKKGYVDGLYFSLITILILFIINLIFIHNFSFRNIYFYIILIVTSIIGGMISNIKRSNN